jgi:hypothetical protein
MRKALGFAILISNLGFIYVSITIFKLLIINLFRFASRRVKSTKELEESEELIRRKDAINDLYF